MKKIFFLLVALLIVATAGSSLADITLHCFAFKSNEEKEFTLSLSKEKDLLILSEKGNMVASSSGFTFFAQVYGIPSEPADEDFGKTVNKFYIGSFCSEESRYGFFVKETEGSLSFQDTQSNAWQITIEKTGPNFFFVGRKTGTVLPYFFQAYPSKDYTGSGISIKEGKFFFFDSSQTRGMVWPVEKSEGQIVFESEEGKMTLEYKEGIEKGRASLALENEVLLVKEVSLEKPDKVKIVKNDDTSFKRTFSNIKGELVISADGKTYKVFPQQIEQPLGIGVDQENWLFMCREDGNLLFDLMGNSLFFRFLVGGDTKPGEVRMFNISSTHHGEIELK